MGIIFYGMYRFRLGQIRRTEQIRSEISKNLHDEVGSTLTNISLGSLLAQKQIQHDAAVNHILERIYQDSQHVSESMREIVWSINPKIDTVGEAFPRMLHYASELLEAKNIELGVEMPPSIEHLKLPMQERRDLYLIFKETVNNLAKYSKATKAMIKFQLDGNTLVMIVSDNGTGFDTSIAYSGDGLKNLQERAQNHQWLLTIDSGAGEGTTITLKTQIA
jgi:signal transduction histidine kinase